MERTYWGNTGAHQELSAQLEKLIPISGAVSSPRSRNKKLEKFRQASNAYYDIFNNGGGNRRELIRRIFGVNMSEFVYRSRDRFGASHTNWTGIHRVVEPIMDRIILEASEEQKLILAQAVKGLEIAGRLETGE